MDTNGPVTTLSTFTIHTSKSSSQNCEKYVSPNVVCDTCDKYVPYDKTTIVHGGICICPECVNKILSLHVLVNNIKTLCVYCFDDEDKSGVCEYCNLDSAIKRLEGDSWEI